MAQAASSVVAARERKAREAEVREAERTLEARRPHPMSLRTATQPSGRASGPSEPTRLDLGSVSTQPRARVSGTREPMWRSDVLRSMSELSDAWQGRKGGRLKGLVQ